MGKADARAVDKEDAIRFVESINDAVEKEANFWELMEDSGKYNFNQSSKWVRSAEKTCVEMIKIAILLGTIYISVLVFMLTDSTLPLGGIGIGVSMGCLIISLFMFSMGYIATWESALNESMENFHQYIEENSDKKEVLQNRSIVFYSLADENSKVLEKVRRKILWGLTFVMGSTGAFVGTLLNI